MIDGSIIYVLQDEIAGLHPTWNPTLKEPDHVPPTLQGGGTPMHWRYDQAQEADQRDCTDCPPWTPCDHTIAEPKKKPTKTIWDRRRLGRRAT